MTAATIEVPSAGQDSVPEAGQLVQVRGQQWVVSGVSRSCRQGTGFRSPGAVLSLSQ
jgi:hypothetical protein